MRLEGRELGKLNNKMVVPAANIATYVAITDGPVVAPVITPRPNDFNSNRIYRGEANVCTKWSRRKLPQNHRANLCAIRVGDAVRIER
jgi:hypothetical protein